MTNQAMETFAHEMTKKDAEIAELKAALNKIANQDYRGNRCLCSSIALRALNLQEKQNV